MTESEQLTLAAIAKKIDDQERANRTMMIVCCISMIGLMAYILLFIFANLPSMVVLHYMGNLELIAKDWNAVQSKFAASKHPK